LLACTKVLNDAEDSNETSSPSLSGLYYAVSLSSAVRSRAYHRRAKGKLNLKDYAGALADARAAAFLGDRGAVALYGKLMRQTQQEDGMTSGKNRRATSSSSGADDSLTDKELSASLLGAALKSSKTQLSADSASGNEFGLTANPFMALMNNGQAAGGLDPLSALAGISGASNGEGGMGGMDSLAKSLLGNLGKRMDETETQEKICNFVKSFGTKQSVTRVATMAGVQLSDAHVNQIAGLCSRLTPQGLNKGVKITKRIIWSVKAMRKAMKVFSKYRHVLVYVVLLVWIKSAIMRPPFPIKKVKQ